jgi:hypothetical protein
MPFLSHRADKPTAKAEKVKYKAETLRLYSSPKAPRNHGEKTAPKKPMLYMDPVASPLFEEKSVLAQANIVGYMGPNANPESDHRARIVILSSNNVPAKTDTAPNMEESNIIFL